MSLAWADHHHTRWQTWEALKLEALIAVGLVGINLTDDGPQKRMLLGFGGALLLALAFSGVMITIHHRAVEMLKLDQIRRIQTELHLGACIGVVEKPAEINWQNFAFVWDRKTATALHILRMHVLIVLFAAGFLGSRFVQ